jgi:hypothetical protein
MKAKILAAALSLFAVIGTTGNAIAHEKNPGGKIIVHCFASGLHVRLTQIADAVDFSSLRASHSVRMEMLGLARNACEKGLTKVVFVPATPRVDVQEPSYAMEVH